DQVGGTPTYADLTQLLAAPAAPAGSAITQRLSAGGVVSIDPALAAYAVTAGASGGPTQRGIASIFEKFLTQQGPVIEEGKVVTEPLFDPAVSVTGYPITEPYWLRVPVGGVQRDVLIQCFQRRCLTYTPSNPAGWQVEMSNIGLAYQQWVTTDPPMASTATPASFVPGLGSLALGYW
ncbi:MAG TPA: peptidase S8, partial [Thermomicrobiaceae bacterium]|nr:peptidase S8 [Thermomicrobiaceae bacterium]